MYEYETVCVEAEPLQIHDRAAGTVQLNQWVIHAPALKVDIQEQLEERASAGWRLSSVIPTVRGYGNGSVAWSRSDAVLLIFERELPAT